MTGYKEVRRDPHGKPVFFNGPEGVLGTRMVAAWGNAWGLWEFTRMGWKRLDDPFQKHRSPEEAAMTSSVGRVASRYLEARSRSPWNEFLDYFRTEEQITQSLYENEIALTEQFFTQEMPEITRMPEVQKLIASFTYKEGEDASPDAQQLSYLIRKTLIRAICGRIRVVGQSLLRKFDPDVRKDVEHRVKGAPTGIRDFIEQMEDLGNSTISGRIKIPFFLKKLGVPMMAFASERVAGEPMVTRTVTLPKRDVPLLQSYCGEMGWTVK